jgi:CheY-like chemotaxis protein
MPGMNGVDLLRALRDRHPGVPAILITGYAETGALDTLDTGDLVLRKPFKLAELAREVELALDGARREG